MPAAVAEELRAERIARARQGQRRQIQGFLGRLVTALCSTARSRILDRQRALVGLQAVLDQLAGGIASGLRAE